MIRTAAWFVLFWLFQILSLPFLAAVLLLGALRLSSWRERLLDWIIHFWARRMIRQAGVRVDVSGLENLPRRGGRLFVANHQSAFDIPLVLGYIPGLRGFISKKENLWLPIVNGWMIALHCLFIDRRDVRQSARVIARGVELLASGHSLVVFPEGTRSRDGALRPFKSGSFKLATRSGAVIVPLTIAGTRQLFEAHGGRIRPGRARLHIHPPIATAGMGSGEREGLAARVQAIVAGGLPETLRSAE